MSKSLSDLLGKLKFERRDATIEITHRGAPNDTKVIFLSSVTKVAKAFFLYGPEDTHIPLHRVRKVKELDRAGRGKVLWPE